MEDNTTREPVHVIGAGLAGSEAAWQVARRGIPVIYTKCGRSDRTRPIRQTGSQSWSAAIPCGRPMWKMLSAS